MTTDLPKPPKPHPKPCGWWSLNVSGTVSGVLKEIDGHGEISAHWKHVLKEEIEYFCKKTVVNFIQIDAHYHLTPCEYPEEHKELNALSEKEQNKSILHMDITGKNVAM